jgi:hypothetical protein
MWFSIFLSLRGLRRPAWQYFHLSASPDGGRFEQASALVGAGCVLMFSASRRFCKYIGVEANQYC